MQRSMGVRDCRVRISKMRQLMGYGIDTRKLGIFLVWVEGSDGIKNREQQGADMFKEGVHVACKYGLVWVMI